MPDSCFKLFLISVNAGEISGGGKKTRAIKFRTKKLNSIPSTYLTVNPIK